MRPSVELSKRRGLRPGLSLFDVAGVIAVGVWLVFMARLLTSDMAPTAENRLEITAEEAAAGFRAGEEWRGVYHRDNKVGFVRLTKRVLDDGFEITVHQVMRLSMMGREQSIDLTVRTEADEDFVLRAFDGTMEASGVEVAVSGRVTELPDGRFEVSYELATLAATHQGAVTLTTAPLIEHDIARALLDRDPQAGDTFETHFFDPMTQREQPVVVEYVGREPLAVLGQTVQAHRLVVHMGGSAGGESLSRWVNDLGEVLKEQLPLGLTSIRESRAEAMYGVVRRAEEAPSTDLVAEARIPYSLAGADAAPVDLERAARLTWRLSGVDPLRYELDGGRQEVRSSDAGAVVLRLLREPHDSALTVEQLDISRDLADHLIAGPLIQSEHPEIVAQSQSITAGLQSVTAIAEAVNTWVFEHLDKVPTVAVPSAADVLATREGDCNEHATLATALLRAAGIPARLAVGVAHMDDAFYYHAWVEYWHDGWRTIDPTWGQMPADLGHIRLISGGLDRQVELIGLFDRAVHIELAAGEPSSPDSSSTNQEPTSNESEP